AHGPRLRARRAGARRGAVPDRRPPRAPAGGTDALRAGGVRHGIRDRRGGESLVPRARRAAAAPFVGVDDRRGTPLPPRRAPPDGLSGCRARRDGACAPAPRRRAARPVRRAGLTPRRLTLAARAVEARPTDHDPRADRRRARPTGLARPVVHGERQLEPSLAAEPVAVVRDRRPAEPDRLV